MIKTRTLRQNPLNGQAYDVKGNKYDHKTKVWEYIFCAWENRRSAYRHRLRAAENGSACIAADVPGEFEEKGLQSPEKTGMLFPAGLSYFERMIDMPFREITPEAIKGNPFTQIGKDWMLVTSGSRETHNTMTASWGGVGVLWGKPVSTVYIRPQRYTFRFMEENEYYSLCFFGEEYRQALTFCGRHSGRDCDKEKETGLTPLFDRQAPYYEQARLALICRKLYCQDLTAESFVDKNVLSQNYPTLDLHRMFIGEIVTVLEK